MLTRAVLLGEQPSRFSNELHLPLDNLKLAGELGARRHQASDWMYLSQCYRKQERWEPALDAIQQCLSLADEAARPSVQLVLASLYLDMDRPQDALAQYEAALEPLRKSDDLLNQLTCLRGGARAHRKLGRDQEAVRMLQEAVDLAHALKLPDEEALRAELATWQTERP